MVLGQYGVILVVIWWYWVQYNMVLIGIEWYWVNKGLLCLYILKKINGDVDQPTDRPTNRQGEYRAICLFRKLENRRKAEICNYFITSILVLWTMLPWKLYVRFNLLSFYKKVCYHQQ